MLDYCGVDSLTSLLPLTSCPGLKELQCDAEAVDLEELRNRMPQLKITLAEEEEEDYNGNDDGDEDEEEEEGNYQG